MFTVKDEFLGSAKTKLARKLGGSDAIVMWLALKTYCAVNLTDGFIPDEAIRDLEGAPRNKQKSLTALSLCGPKLPEGGRKAGLVERLEHGWKLHDYLDHEASAEQIKRKRALKAARQKRWRDAHRVDAVDTERQFTQPSTRGASTEPHDVDAGDASLARARTNPTQPNPRRRDLLADSLRGGAGARPDVQEVHAVWRQAVDKPNHRFRGTSDFDAATIAEAVDTYTLADCLTVARWCLNDGMVSGKTDERRKKHDSIRYIFGNNDAFNRILEAAKKHTGESRRKRNPSELLPQDKDWREDEEAQQ